MTVNCLSEKGNYATALFPCETSAGCEFQRSQAGTRHFPGNERGFTLIEVLVSVVLMTIGLFAVIQMQIVALNQSTIAYRLTTAGALAESALEDVMSWDINDVRLASTTTTTTGFSFGDSPFLISNVSYTASYTLLQNTPVAHMAQVVVTVTGGGRNITIKSYRTTP